jgi:hypothetical protein
MRFWQEKLRWSLNESESAARFIRQVAAWVTEMFRDFYIVKNYEVANNPTTTKAKEK